MKHEGFNLKITTADGKFEKVEMRFISGFWYEIPYHIGDLHVPYGRYIGDFSQNDMIAWIEQEYIQDGKRATVEIVD